MPNEELDLSAFGIYPESEEAEEETESTTTASGTETPQFKQIREALKRRDRDAKAFEKKLQAAEARLGEISEAQRASAAKTALTGLGLSEKLASTFLKVHEGEVDEASVRQFAADNGLITDDVERASVEPTTGGTTTGSELMTEEAFQALLKSNPNAAVDAVSQGRYTPQTTL